MSPLQDSRSELLRRLVAYERPIEPIIDSLKQFPFDSDSELVCVAAVDLVRVIERCLSGELSVDQVAEWADFLEVRDDVGFDTTNGDRVSEIIFDLANPLINGAVTREKLSAIRSELLR